MKILLFNTSLFYCFTCRKTLVMKSILSLLIVGVLSFAFPQVITLTGTVKDSSTLKGIAGAAVSLKIEGISASTDSTGRYMFGLGARPCEARGGAVAKAPIVRQGSVYFGIVGDNLPVRIDICDLLGRTIAPAIEKKLGRGSYRFTPFGNACAANLCFVKLKINNIDFAFCMLDIGGSGGYGLSRMADNSSSGAFSKSAALVIDTIVVTAVGYTVVRKPISSYVGTNDFLISPVSGHKTIVSFDNGSYQSCIVPLVITVVDSDRAGATVSVTLRSATDPAGIVAPLRKVPGVAGTYSDSVFFSISKSDSVKRTIRVSDGDRVWALYAEAVQPEVDSISTSWTGVTGIVQPGGSPILGVVRPLSIHVWDSDVTDSTVSVHVSSTRDKTGFPVPLRAAAGSTGDFYGRIWFSLRGSVADSVLAVKGSASDTITIIYHDLTPAQDITPPACIWLPVPAVMFLDSGGYHGTGSIMTVNLSDDDIGDSIAIVNIKSRKDPAGISDTLHVTGTAVRSFVGTAGFTTGPSHPGFIAVQDGDSVVVSYQDDSPVQTITQSASWNSK
jgi:hypothetical protein